MAIDARARFEIDRIELARDGRSASTDERRVGPEIDELVGGLGANDAEQLASSEEIVSRLTFEQRSVDEEARGSGCHRVAPPRPPRDFVDRLRTCGGW